MIFINTISIIVTLTLATIFKRSIAGYLFVLLSASYIGALLNNYTIQLNEEKIISHFTSLLLLILIMIPFGKYKIKYINLEYKEIKTKIAGSIIINISLVIFAINLLILSFSILQFFRSGVSVEVYKNGFIGIESLSSVPSYVIQFSLAFTPLAYFALGYHFFYMINVNKKMLIASLLASFNIIMPSLFLFGRGGLVLYVLIYISMLYYTYPLINEKIRRRLTTRSISYLSLLILFLFLISASRFSEYSAPPESFIKSQLTYSLIDYYSQWIPNSIEVIHQYSTEKSTNYSTISYIPNKITSFFTDINNLLDLKEIRANSLGDFSTFFNGLTTILIYDFGYIGTLLFIAIYGLLLYITSPKKGKACSLDIIKAPFLIAFPVLFFQGSIFVFADYNLAFIYLVIIYMFFKIRFIS